jgi:prepilin-type N-terminal cleavage/methylation domain-containing protein
MNKQKGFTLVEAAAAIAVVAILSGIIIPLVLKNIRDSQLARAKNDLQVIAAAIASQLKDTGGQPDANSGLAGADAADATADAIWYSTVNAPAGPAAAAGVLAFQANPVPAQSFKSLLSRPSNNDESNLMFGFAAGHPAGAEFGYKGPYLSADMAGKSDPWGRAYVILGYNGNGRANNGPIWVVSAGPGGTIAGANMTLVGNVLPATWTGDNLAIRVN